jgi:hypothetical protein
VLFGTSFGCILGLGVIDPPVGAPLDHDELRKALRLMMICDQDALSSRRSRGIEIIK